MVRNKEPMVMTEDQKISSVQPWRFGPGNSGKGMSIRVESSCNFGLTPSIPSDHRSFRIVKHDKFGGVKKVVKFLNGNLYVGGKKVFSGMVKIQGMGIEGFRIGSLIRNGKHCLANANFVDFLTANPDFYPDNHKVEGHCLVSWGTVYHDMITSRDCLKAVRWDTELNRPEVVTKTLFDNFCDKCFYISFSY